MINLHERTLPTSAGVEPAISWSPVGRRIQLSHRGRPCFPDETQETKDIHVLHLHYFGSIFVDSLFDDFSC